VATVEIDGPFKIETKPHTIAAREIPPTEAPTAVTTKRICRRVAVTILVIVIGAFGLATLVKRRGKKQQPE
jgi:hypothetical protein